MTASERLSGIHRRYLHDEVAQRLRALIRVGELEPRALNDSSSPRASASREPPQEAIKILATEGLLELLPNRARAWRASRPTRSTR